MIVLCQTDVVARVGSVAIRHAFRKVRGVLFLLLVATASPAHLPTAAQTVEADKSERPIEERVQALRPDLEAYIVSGMKAFDVPGLAIGIVAGDKLFYAKGFGVRAKGGTPVDTQTIFQIGSTTKAFLTTTMAIAVDQGKLH